MCRKIHRYSFQKYWSFLLLLHFSGCRVYLCINFCKLWNVSPTALQILYHCQRMEVINEIWTKDHWKNWYLLIKFEFLLSSLIFSCNIHLSPLFWRSMKSWNHKITKYSGKRSIGLPGIIFFFHDAKGFWGHCLGQSGPRWNHLAPPKKCFQLWKRPIWATILLNGFNGA